jgi:hypothetical protein
MRTGARWPLLLLAWMLFDFAHPGAPGVFFLEADRLFVDSAVGLGKTAPPRPTAAHEPGAAPRVERLEPRLRPTRAVAGDGIRRVAPRLELVRHAPPGGRSSPPPSSPDAH